MCSLSFGIYKVRADISWVTLSGHRAAPPWNQSPLRTFSWPLIELHKLCKPLISRAFWGHTWDRSHPGTKCFCETLQIAMQEASMEMGEVGQALGGYTGSSPHTENTSKKTVHMLWRSSFPPKPHLTSGVFIWRHRCQSWKGSLRTPSTSPLSCRGTNPRSQGNGVAWLGFVECLHSSK